MARKAASKTKPAATKKAATAAADGESVAGYFRGIFKENPKLLKGRNNEELLQRWLADHPGHAEVPRNVKASLSNLKSILRSKKRKAGKKKAEEGEVVETAAVETLASEPAGVDLALEHLEEQIDDVLMAAKGMNREDLEEVVVLLRRARNAVVWKIGQ
jgi:hypothetical protein